MKHLPIISNLNSKLYFSIQQVLTCTICVLILGSCKTPFVNLPAYDKVYEDPYGAMITIRYKDNVNRTQNSIGELISVENDSIYILTKTKTTYNNRNPESYEIITIHQKKTNSYKVVFAQSEPNGAFLASGILVFTHGFFMLTSIPINVVLGALVMGEEKYLYSFTDRQIKVENLFKFCRFPSGIPANLDLNKLKMRPVKK
ncbi:MAG: hypothetical protein IPN79_01340 [Saprospiraceae bacterium]|nr:hypothetical protein [Saprospiraceae bacterium]